MYLNSEIPQNEEQKRSWIKYRLKIQGKSLASLAREHKTSRQVLSNTLYEPSPRWEYVIAQALNKKPTEIWPERYEDGLPKEKLKV